MPTIQIDPIDSLSLTLHHSPGVQALLLGSGISRSAGVPTGWEITLDLIRRLGSVQGVSDQQDWTAWYRETYKKEPSYSEILDAVAAAPAERRSVIHAYIEAQDGDDPRQPTAAHRAIANLVALGSIRVVLTTNFDRLLENALRDVGIEPTVIGSDDAILGATPLVHSRCTIIKLHGDYMDARIKNTQDELKTYSPAMDALVDRVLDEYGLIIAGWSGDWDTALRAAIMRTPSRRFPFYWASRGALSQLGNDLLNQRAGKLIPITDADSFFMQLRTKVEALAAMNRVHPESIALLVAEGKKLCRDDRYSAEWSDLLAHEVSRFSDWVRSPEFFQGSPDNASINDLVKRIVAKSEGLRRLVMIGARWGTDEAFRTMLRAIVAITFRDMDGSGFTYVISLRLLGASLCFHWGVAASLLRADAYDRAYRLMHLIISAKYEQGLPAVTRLPLAALSSVEWKFLDGLERRHTPHSDYFSEIFLNEAKDIVVGPNEADAVWDDSEFLIAAESGYQRLLTKEDKDLWFWVPFGRFVWRRESGTSISQRMDYLRGLSDTSPELKAGLFGGSMDGLNKTLPKLTKFFEEEGSRYSW
ncbi:SIR2 family protein [Novosphingobium sp. YJ-S2-02]|uniref:SIR2 family protein n=1 Tax=Novosphingobium aureum TaxID=2792964 RepID=A0A931HBF0_9SPHN|nr:SIR2 family protein [Novosphingobium aureum]MBH0112379.1 SIR2 family protein [Novosphingobium aureum]